VEIFAVLKTGTSIPLLDKKMIEKETKAIKDERETRNQRPNPNSLTGDKVDSGKGLRSTLA
jgi:hypothetical protein